MVTRYQIRKRKTKGWNVIEYPSNFRGYKVHIFMSKKGAEKFVKNKGWKK